MSDISRIEALNLTVKALARYGDDGDRLVSLAESLLNCGFSRKEIGEFFEEAGLIIGVACARGRKAKVRL